MSFNAANSDVRLRFLDHDDAHVDVFLDELRLCHAVKFSTTAGNTIEVHEFVPHKNPGC